MRTLRRMITLSVAVLAAAFASFTIASTASAAPAYPPVAPTITLSSTVVAPGGAVTVRGTGFTPGESVSVDIHSDAVHLATVTADADGVATADVTIPSGFSGHHTITMTGLSSGLVLSIGIDIQSGAAGGSATGSSSGGGLAFTGFDLPVVTGAAAGLLILGGLFVMVGRRRRSSSV